MYRYVVLQFERTMNKSSHFHFVPPFQWACHLSFTPTAFRMAKTQWSFGFSECNSVRSTSYFFWGDKQEVTNPTSFCNKTCLHTG